MKATLGYTDGRTKEVDFDYHNAVVPLLKHEDELFVLRSYVLGYVDNASRQGENTLFYIQTHALDV
jgi:hypothetical protein